MARSYQSKSDALARGLVSVDESNTVRLGVDSTHQYTTSDRGRPSVRLTSLDSYNHGLFIADFAHMPASTVSTSSHCYSMRLRIKLHVFRSTLPNTELGMRVVHISKLVIANYPV
jgi:hypothetical protein